MNLKQETVRLLNYRVQELKRSHKIKHKSNSFFENLSSEFGYEVLMAWMKDHFGENEGKKVIDYGSHDFESMVLNEFHVMQLFGELFLEVYEYKVYELFDLFQKHFTFQELYVIVVLAVAIEENKSLEFLYLMGDSLFSLISSEEEVVPKASVRKLLKLIGLGEGEIRRQTQAISMEILEILTFEEFELLLFAFFEQKQGKDNLTSKVRNKSCLMSCSLF